MRDSTAAGTELAIVADAEGLVSVDVQSGALARLYTGPVEHCAMDPRSDAVWFLAGHDTGATEELRALDLRAPERGAIVVARSIPADTDTLIIDHGGGDFVGGRDGMSFELGLRVSLSGEPRLSAYMGCEGDAIFACLENGEEGAFREDLVAREAGLRRAEVVDAKAMKALHDRGRGPVHLGLQLEEKPRIAIDPSACDADPDRCGAAQALPGGDRWLVVTGNSHGDYYHELLQFYDPKTHEFSPLADPTSRTKTAVDGGDDFDGLLLASTGRAYVLGPEVFHLDRGKVFSGVEACGFRSPGYLVPGLTWTSSLHDSEGLSS